jgi:hypothetical protein
LAEIASRRAARRSWPAARVILFVLALSAGACGSDPSEPQRPAIGSMRLTVGAQTLIYSNAGTLAATLMAASSPVAASFVGVDGSQLLLSGDEFEIRLTPRSGIVTFNRLTPFSGTLNRSSLGSVIVDVQIFDKLAGRADFNVVLNLNLQ